MDLNFDLLGDFNPQEGRSRGRPEHRRTDENANKVRLLLGVGWTQKDIAAALGVTQPTLKKHYFSELKFRGEARRQVEATVWMELMNQVAKGNVGAIREFNRRIEKFDLDAAGDRLRAQQDRAQAKEPKLGKKEQANLDAQTAHKDTEWEDLLQRPEHLN